MLSPQIYANILYKGKPIHCSTSYDFLFNDIQVKADDPLRDEEISPFSLFCEDDDELF
jgi:hypothetical protein